MSVEDAIQGPDSPIGIFDSGIGGLSVLKAVHNELPGEDIIFFADQANVPYGSRSLEEVQQFSIQITRFLLKIPVKLIVIACNTASAAALHWLRTMYPNIPFVGMEPAVKPAAEETKTGRVGVLATPATFQGKLYASVLERFAQGVKIFQDTCPGLVQQIEAGEFSSYETRRILEKALNPMLLENIDIIVLGCTHYPFVIPLIEDICGDSVRVIDPSPAIARQVRRVLEREGLLKGGLHKDGLLEEGLHKKGILRLEPRDSSGTTGKDKVSVRTFTSGDAQKLEKMFAAYAGFSSHVEAVSTGQLSAFG